MGDPTLPKQFLPLQGIPILGHTLTRFDHIDAIDQIILVTRQQDTARCRQLLTTCRIRKATTLVPGGQVRQESVFHGLQHLPPDADIVLIHDAVRIFITSDLMTALIQATRTYGASIAAVPVQDTIKHVEPRPPGHPHEPPDPRLFVKTTLDRTVLWHVQTPQAFRASLIRTVHHQARESGLVATDDAMLAEHFGHPVAIVPSSYRNIKITTPTDLLIAQAFLRDEAHHAARHDIPSPDPQRRNT
jgi:2-C-methyl-D-erythritol 4-phosphate cytidylyltransferase